MLAGLIPPPGLPPVMTHRSGGEDPEPPTYLQDRYAPHGVCFGCGPANPQGLRIKSRVDGDAVVADWTPEPHHHAFEGYVNGGILSTLFDCHSNWAATYFLMKARGLPSPHGTVTAKYCVTFRRPTPMGRPLRLTSRLREVREDRVSVETTLEAEGQVTATCEGTFVAVREGHPAFGRWK